MSREVSPSTIPRKISGSVSFSVDEDVQRGVVVPVLLFLARTAALWLARVAVRTALARFSGNGLALSTLARTLATGAVFGGSKPPVLSALLSKCWGATEESNTAGGDGEGAVSSAMSGVGMAAGGQLPSASFLLSSRRLFLLACSLLLLPVFWVEAPPPSAGIFCRNQRQISSVSPSVSSTSLAGIPFLLQVTHAKYCV